MQTFLHLIYEYEFDLPDQFDGDPRISATYIEHFLSEFTDSEDTVFDPFAGFGTTFRVAEPMSALTRTTGIARSSISIHRNTSSHMVVV